MRMPKVGIWKNQAKLPCSCNFQILLSYNRDIQAYMIWTLKDTHNHQTGESEFRLYATERRPDDELHNTAVTLLSHGTNPTLLTQFLNDNNALVQSHDVHNLKHKLNFRGKQSCCLI